MLGLLPGTHRLGVEIAGLPKMGPAFGARGTAWEGGTQKSGGGHPSAGTARPHKLGTALAGATTPAAEHPHWVSVTGGLGLEPYWSLG